MYRIIMRDTSKYEYRVQKRFMLLFWITEGTHSECQGMGAYDPPSSVFYPHTFATYNEAYDYIQKTKTKHNEHRWRAVGHYR